MKKYLVVMLVSAGLCQWTGTAQSSVVSLQSKISPNLSSNANRYLSATLAFENRESNIQVQGSGQVVRVLSDDNTGARHQKFILRLTPNHTILVAHNIDLAPRIGSLIEGDMVDFYGEYEWQHKGGVVHWTHADPNGKHIGGWLKHKGRTYQ